MTPQELILSHINTARKLAAKYGARRNDSDRDEILSAAYFGLVRAAKKPNPKNAYIAKCIRGEVRRTISRLNANKTYTLVDTICEVDNTGAIFDVCTELLPKRLHRTFLLYHRDGLTQEEVATKTGDSRKLVQAKLAEAMAILLLNKDEIADILF